MKRSFSLALCLLLVLTLWVPALAVDELTLITGDGQTTAEDAIFIRDNAGLLSGGEQSALEQRAAALADRYGCGVYVLTVDSIGGTNRREYAKAYYQDNQLGCGDWRNGILFLVAMESRDYVTVTYGQNPSDQYDYGIGINAFSDYGVSRLEEQVVPYLSDGDYSKAFDVYVDICGSYLERYTETGEPYDVGDAPRSIAVPLAITVLVPLIVALVVCLILRGQMKTARAAARADEYIPSDGFRLTRQADRYTHTTRTVRHIERSSDSGGGSSVDSGGFGGSSGGKF